MTRLRTVLIGFGAVGREVAERVSAGEAGEVEIVGVAVREPARYAGDAARLGIPFVTSAAELATLHPAVAVEAGGHDAFRAHVPALLEAGIEVLALSAGALADPELLARVEAAARSGATRLRIPSGAIAALDAISAAAVGEVTRVTHSVVKPPAALLSSHDADAVMATGLPRELYEGPARDAAVRFPANVNVVAAVSLAGIGLDRTTARIVADPSVTRNTHEVVVEGAFGRLAVRIENEPSANPKTGRIVALSLVRALRAYGEPIVVGG